MGRKCNVQDCPSDSNRPEDTGVTFHKMPFHQDLRPKWISLCRIADDKQSNRVIYVCSRHFLRADFCNFKGTKYMLKQGALPSVFPWSRIIPKVANVTETRSKSSGKDATPTRGKKIEKGKEKADGNGKDSGKKEGKSGKDESKKEVVKSGKDEGKSSKSSKDDVKKEGSKSSKDDTKRESKSAKEEVKKDVKSGKDDVKKELKTSKEDNKKDGKVVKDNGRKDQKKEESKKEGKSVKDGKISKDDVKKELKIVLKEESRRESKSSKEDSKKEGKNVKDEGKKEGRHSQESKKTVKSLDDEKKHKTETKRASLEIKKEVNASPNESLKSKMELKIEKNVQDVIQSPVKSEKKQVKDIKVEETKELPALLEIKREVKEETAAGEALAVETPSDQSQISSDAQVFEATVETKIKNEELKNKTPKEKSQKIRTPKSGSKSSSKPSIPISPLPAAMTVKAEPQSPISLARNTVINFVPGIRIEALDFNQCWYPAKVVEVDFDDHEVLIHFEKFSHRYDEWIQMDSSRLRPLNALKKMVEIYRVGERCMAVWSDSRKFPGTVSRVLADDTYEVLFDDGFVKCMKHYKLSKMTNVPDSLPAASTLMVKAAPLFEPAKGSKQERRDKKRKIASVAELFSNKKKSKAELAEEWIPYPPEVTHGSSDIEGEEWTCRWVNGEPVGTPSVIETHDGQRRKSVIVADHRLPPGWQKHFSRRLFGTAVGKYDCYIVNPEGRKFRTRVDILRYLDDLQVDHSLYQFDFSLHMQRARKLGLYEVTASAQKVKREVEPEPEPQPIQEEELSSGGLKILWENDSFKCPIEGCGKNFRKENLAQMHIKHYHPEYSQFMGSTPNVADLAYARTVGDSLERPSPSISDRIRPLKVSTPKTPIGTPKLLSPSADQETASASKQKDSEIIKLLNKPSSYEYKSDVFESKAIPDMKLRELLCKSEASPRFTHHEEAPPRVGGIKTLLPVARRAESKDASGKLPDEMLVDAHAPHKGQKRRRTTGGEAYEPPLSRKKVGDPVDQFEVKEETIMLEPAAPKDVIIEGGEVIKIVHMRREEIINCTCGITEEDGLMIQCELCFCWQHAYCNGIERESQVPEKYVCYICQHPIRQRVSKKYFHDQDWLKHGNLPTGNYHCKDEEELAKRFALLKNSHQLSGGLIELKDFIHSLRMKLNIAETKDHPKLYLWSKIWDKPTLQQSVKEENDNKEKLASSETGYLKKTEIDTILNVLNMLKPEDKDTKLNFPKIDLNSLMSNNLEQMQAVVQPPVAPQPEAAIESADCRLNLLEHIEHCQKQVDERLDDFEAQINLLENANLPGESDESYPRTKQTLLMLLKDLSAMKQLAALN